MGQVPFFHGYYKSSHNQNYVKAGICGSRRGVGFLFETSHVGLPEHKKTDSRGEGVAALEDMLYDGS